MWLVVRLRRNGRARIAPQDEQETADERAKSGGNDREAKSLEKKSKSVLICGSRSCTGERCVQGDDNGGTVQYSSRVQQRVLVERSSSFFRMFVPSEPARPRAHGPSEYLIIGPFLR
jgi:hypothetical protein